MFDFKSRRTKLLSKIGNNAAIVTSNNLKQRSNDTEFSFRQSSNFYYLTGHLEDNAILLLTPNSKDKTHLFVQKKDPFLELWNGKRLGIDQAKVKYSIDCVYDIDDFSKLYQELIINHDSLYVELETKFWKRGDVLKGFKDLLNKRIKAGKFAPRNLLNITPLIQELRAYKSQEEIETMKHALKITNKAHRMAMAYTKDGVYEYQIQGMLELVCKLNDNCPMAYGSIVASGNNANILHYVENNTKVKNGDLLLIDAGCEYNLYASDITRTFPVSGKYEGEAKALYEMVLDVQRSDIESIAPGLTLNEITEKSAEKLLDGLLSLKVLTGSKEEHIEKKSSRKYFPHRLGHWLGLDVHDQNPYTDSSGELIKFQKGMVITIEPGIYIPEDLSLIHI